MITSKYFKIILGIFLSIAIIFTMIITFIPKQSTKSQGVVKEYETKIFSEDDVMSINISMNETSWNEMLKNAINEEYYKCDITINGETFKNVGIRPKGNTTLMQIANDSTTDRYSFKIKFDKYVDGQTCYGLDKMVINNMMSDTTYMKEYLSYDLMNYIGVNTPLYAYSDVSVNGEKWGLYLAIETLEESFAERIYGDDYGMLYKPESINMGGGNKLQGGGLPEGGRQGNGERPEGEPQGNGEKPEGEPQGNSKMPEGIGPGNNDSRGADLVYTDDKKSSYSTIFDSAIFDTTTSDKNRVIKALKNLNEGNNLETYINVDETLRYFAANTMLVNLDSYVSNLKHNYYLYEKDGQLSILPWDFNLSFAGFQSGNSTSAVNFPIDTPVTGVELSDRPLIGKFLEVDKYKETYHNYLQVLVDDYFNSGLFETKVEKINNLIKDYVKNDPTAFYTYKEYEDSISILKEFMTLRSESVNGQLKGTIPATTSEQNKNSNKLVDASSISLQSLGHQGGKVQGNNNDIAGEHNGDKTNVKSIKNDVVERKDKSNLNSQANNKLMLQTIGYIGVMAIAFVFIIKFKRRKI